MNQKKRIICCVPTCKGERFDLAHKFPRCTERALMWLDAIDCPHLNKIPLQKLSQIYQVCSRHFRVEDYKHSLSRSLNMTAIPSLNLKDLSELHLSKNSTPTCSKIQTIIIEDLIEKPVCDDKLESTIEEHVVIPKEELVDPLKDDSEKIQTVDQWTDENKLKPSSTENTNRFSTFLEVRHPSYENKLSLNTFWLRCHCRCSLCYDPTTCRRKISPMDISSDIQPKSVEQVDGLDILSIEWDDSHKSNYDVNFLFTSQINEESRSFYPIPWHTDSVCIQEHKSNKFNQLISSEENIELLFQNLSQSGFTVIENIPTQSNAMAQFVVCRLFSQLQTVYFGEFKEAHSDICTNLTYSSADCGLKCFFVTQQVKIILVDGLNVAQKLIESNAIAFKTLSCVTVPLEMNDHSIKWKIKAPIIEVDPETKEILRVRLDVHRIGILNTLPQGHVEQFYDSLREMIKMTQSDENQLVLTLKPGSMVILDNWRILHKCAGNSGISQCFIERRDFVSRMRYFGLM